MEHTTNIKRTVMRRVYTLFVLRELVSKKVLGALLLLTSLYGFGRLVFVAEVLKNIRAQESVSAFFTYVFDALLHTEFLVHVTLAFVVLGAVLMITDTLRLLRGIRKVQIS